MFTRVSFVLLALFWVIMNFLLWEAQYGSGESTGSPIPVSLVWGKVLTAPDNSMLTMRYHGKTVGFCRWSTAVSEEMATLEEAPSSGQPPRKYRIRLDGNIQMPDTKETLRFESSLRLASRTNWSEFTLRVRFQSLVAHVRASEAEQAVQVSITNGPAVMNRVFRFADLQNPQILLSGLIGPLLSGMPEGFELPPLPQTSRSELEAVQWEAWADTVYVSHQPLHVYRIHGRIAGLFNVVLHVSPVGEIFKVQLPDSLILLHDRMIVY